MLMMVAHLPGGGDLSLRELREAGLVAAGRSNRYRLASSHLDQLSSLLGGW
jgi:hypothetical protein